MIKKTFMKKLILLPLAALLFSCSSNAIEEQIEIQIINEDFKAVTEQRIDFDKNVETSREDRRDYFMYYNNLDQFSWYSYEGTKIYKPIKQTENNFWVVQDKDTIQFIVSKDRIEMRAGKDRVSRFNIKKQ